MPLPPLGPTCVHLASPVRNCPRELLRPPLPRSVVITPITAVRAFCTSACRAPICWWTSTGASRWADAPWDELARQPGIVVTAQGGCCSNCASAHLSAFLPSAHSLLQLLPSADSLNSLPTSGSLAANMQVCDFNLAKIMADSSRSSSLAAMNPRWLVSGGCCVCSTQPPSCASHSLVLHNQSPPIPRAPIAWLLLPPRPMQAPEVMRGEHGTAASDVFGFAVVLWELLTWQLPWTGENNWRVSACTPGVCTLAGYHLRTAPCRPLRLCPTPQARCLPLSLAATFHGETTPLLLLPPHPPRHPHTHRLQVW